MTNNNFKFQSSQELAKLIRLRSLELCTQKNTSHIGGAFSVADIIAVLYHDILNFDPRNPRDPNRDRLFFSKGHACVTLYSVLEILGFFPSIDLLKEFTRNGTYFTSHINHHIPGIELSTGSLGHALGIGCGVSLAAKIQGRPFTIFTIVSDGELDEGSNWEAILFAPQHKLDNMVVIVDYNKIQSFGSTNEVLSLDPLKDKFISFNWKVAEIDGHSHMQIQEILTEFKNDRMSSPKVIIAHTIKGKGVDFMENQLKWHYKAPNSSEYEIAKKQIMETM